MNHYVLNDKNGNELRFRLSRQKSILFLTKIILVCFAVVEKSENLEFVEY